ncbi:MAG: hypothetical protein NVSMB13_14910 [Mycobacteriales bacterium]
MPAYDATMRLWRGDSSGGDFQTFTVPVEEGEVVLDAIHRVQATQAGDLAVRWNCKAGKCGSCSAEINGKPRLMCMTRLNTFDPAETITVNPLKTFPIIKDLVTDVVFNYEKSREVPTTTLTPPDADGNRRMSQAEVTRGQEFHKCIECFLCQDTCHVIREFDDNKVSFAGPRLFLRYADLAMHPLDTNDKVELDAKIAGIGMCNITKCCGDVCPEGIHITDNAIIPLKERVVDRKYDPLVWLGSKIARRDSGSRTPRVLASISPFKRPGAWVPGPEAPRAVLNDTVLNDTVLDDTAALHADRDFAAIVPEVSEQLIEAAEVPVEAPSESQQHPVEPAPEAATGRGGEAGGALGTADAEPAANAEPLERPRAAPAPVPFTPAQPSSSSLSFSPSAAASEPSALDRVTATAKGLPKPVLPAVGVAGLLGAWLLRRRRK